MRWIPVILMFFVVSCKTEVKAPNDLVSDLCDKNWGLDSMVNQTSGQSLVLPDTFTAGLVFHASGEIWVDAPCNNGGGSFTLDGSHLMVFSLALTEMACEQLNYETLFVNNLSGVISMSDSTFIIKSDGGYTLFFHRFDEK